MFISFSTRRTRPASRQAETPHHARGLLEHQVPLVVACLKTARVGFPISVRIPLLLLTAQSRVGVFDCLICLLETIAYWHWRCSDKRRLWLVRSVGNIYVKSCLWPAGPGNQFDPQLGPLFFVLLCTYYNTKVHSDDRTLNLTVLRYLYAQLKNDQRP